MIHVILRNIGLEIHEPAESPSISDIEFFDFRCLNSDGTKAIYSTRHVHGSDINEGFDDNGSPPSGNRHLDIGERLHNLRGYTSSIKKTPIIHEPCYAIQMARRVSDIPLKTDMNADRFGITVDWRSLLTRFFNEACAITKEREMTVRRNSFFCGIAEFPTRVHRPCKSTRVADLSLLQAEAAEEVCILDSYSTAISDFSENPSQKVNPPEKSYGDAHSIVRRRQIRAMAKTNGYVEFGAYSSLCVEA